MKTRRKKSLKLAWRLLLRQKALGLLLALCLALVAALAAGAFFLKGEGVREALQQEALRDAHVEEPPAPTATPAVPPPMPHGTRPRISIIMDDMGVDHSASQRAINLPVPLTLSFLPYAADVQAQVDAARARGHEIFLHLPMQASGEADAGPNALKLGLTEEEIRQIAEKNLNAFAGYVGINNHMGSAFSADEASMRSLLLFMREKGLFYVDSRTTAQSAFEKLCREMQTSCIRRDVFLDHVNTPEAIKAKLDELVWIAERKGYALGISHPYQNTLALFEQILPNLATRVDIVPVHENSRTYEKR